MADTQVGMRQCFRVVVRERKKKPTIFLLLMYTEGEDPGVVTWERVAGEERIPRNVIHVERVSFRLFVQELRVRGDDKTANEVWKIMSDEEKGITGVITFKNLLPILTTA